ncbi:hypothetical protein BW12_09185 [Bifidobacterium sp. UTCIF-3]|nr:hypothetical protein BW09_08415 [Bifidobacterium sp. UTCIF-1]TPF80095.1 hypothetical protein BW08_06135 [Bifidobacterium sp. UTCIF-24]TPF81543.1 hypothetical protein BW12_09185 [Bifidobacterium sp. UTCIF-3]TPF83752.1 hypothetical protein BW07_08345 [Bifidobacterium sp. UTCIF-36]
MKAFGQLGFIRIPVDPVELMASAGIQVMPYSVGLDVSNLDDLLMLSGCPSGISFTLQEADGDIRLVFYNNYESDGRNRFTNAHEAAHCFLGHKGDSPLAEKQANYWGRYSIAPPAIINCLGLSSGDEVAERFGLSAECGGYAFKAYLGWLHHRAENKPIDDAILDLYRRGLLLENREGTQGLEAAVNATEPLHTGKDVIMR